MPDWEHVAVVPRQEEPAGWREPAAVGRAEAVWQVAGAQPVKEARRAEPSAVSPGLVGSGSVEQPGPESRAEVAARPARAAPRAEVAARPALPGPLVQAPPARREQMVARVASFRAAAPLGGGRSDQLPAQLSVHSERRNVDRRRNVLDRSGSGPFEVYCDMTTDGGGWTRVAGISAADHNHVNSAAVNSCGMTTATALGKFSDAVINSLKSGAIRLSG